MVLTADGRLCTYSMILENKAQPYPFMKKPVAMPAAPKRKSNNSLSLHMPLSLSPLLVTR